MSTVYERVVEIINKHQEKKSIEIMPESRFTELGVNSIKWIKLMVDVENEFEIEVDEEILIKNDFKTINDLCDYISISLK